MNDINWPSENVKQGGLFHPPKVVYSQDTHNFISGLMDEARLTSAQRNEVNYFLRSGGSLPRPGGRKSSLKYNQQQGNQMPILNRTLSSMGKRRIETIIASGAYDAEKVVPRLGAVDREKEKLRLQNRMAYGDDNGGTVKVNVERKSQGKETEMNRFDQLVQEIEDREQWLEKMIELGEGHKYEAQIRQEVQGKVREMQSLKIE